MLTARSGRDAHARSALRPLIADDNNFASFDLAIQDRLQRKFLGMKYTGRPFKSQALLAGNFRNGPSGGQAALEYLYMPAGLDRIGHGMDNLLSVSQVRHIRQVLGQGFTRNGQTISINKAFGEQVLEYRGRTPDIVHILHDILSAGFQICQERHPVGHGLKVIEPQFYTHCSRHGDQVDDRIC